MAVRADVKTWVVESLDELEDGATVVALCERIWLKHEHELRASGPLFYSWQVHVRRALVSLRLAGVVHKPEDAPPGTWTLRR